MVVKDATELDAWRLAERPLAPQARGLIRELRDQGLLTADRTAHTLAVGDKAADMVRPLDMPEMWKDEVEATAVLHDVGYAFPVTGMHAVDGGRALLWAGVGAAVCGQVAWHSTALWEISARGLPVDLVAEFGQVDRTVHDIVWVADFTTSPAGESVTVLERLAEIKARYPADSPVVAALHAAQPELDQALERVAALQAGQQVGSCLWPVAED